VVTPITCQMWFDRDGLPYLPWWGPGVNQNGWDDKAITEHIGGRFHGGQFMAIFPVIFPLTAMADYRDYMTQKYNKGSFDRVCSDNLRNWDPYSLLDVFGNTIAKWTEKYWKPDPPTKRYVHLLGCEAKKNTHEGMDELFRYCTHYLNSVVHAKYWNRWMLIKPEGHGWPECCDPSKYQKTVELNQHHARCFHWYWFERELGLPNPEPDCNQQTFSDVPLEAYSYEEQETPTKIQHNRTKLIQYVTDLQPGRMLCSDPYVHPKIPAAEWDRMYYP